MESYTAGKQIEDLNLHWATKTVSSKIEGLNEIYKQLQFSKKKVKLQLPYSWKIKDSF